jgi:hypothetical protein
MTLSVIQTIFYDLVGTSDSILSIKRRLVNNELGRIYIYGSGCGLAE